MKKEAENIYKRCRENAGLTQEQAAENLYIAPRTLSGYENGESTPNQKLASEMALLYRTPSLAWWHLRESNPDLARYIMPAPNLITNGDMLSQLDYANDDIANIKKTMKASLRDGYLTPEEAKEARANAPILRSTASELMEIAAFIEEKVPEA